MNIQLLKALVDLSEGDECSNLDALFGRFPKNQATLNSLKDLEKSGYITITYSEDDIETFIIQQKGFNYFK